MAQRFLSNIRINDAYTFPASDGTSGQVISTDGAGNLSFIDVESEAGATVIYKDNFSGDDSTLTFTLANVVSDEVITQVYIDGVYQNKDTYITSGDQITFSSAPPNGVEIEIISFNTVSTQGIIAYNAKNSTGSTIAAGTAVMAVGTDGNSGHILIAPMIADGSVEPKYFMGITADEVVNGEYVDVVHFGVVGKINTSSFTDGDVLWLDPANDGGFTVTEPNAPNIKIASAIVLNASTNGKIFVRVQGNEGLHELHDVHIENLADKDLLVYNTTQGYWENSKTLGDITTGNITTSGTVDGVDVSAFKSDYDTHTHTESEVTDFGNYVTNVTHDAANTKLVVTTRDGLTQDLDISQYIDDTNLAYIQSGTLDGATGIATFTRDDATSFTVDLSALLDDTDTNDFLTGASFNTADGVLTLTVQNQSDVTVDLDGRYLESFTETDPTVPSHVKSISTINISNWDTAYGWGNHASAGYLTSLPSHNHDGSYLKRLGDVTVTNFDTLPEGVLGSNETTATNQPYANHHITLTLYNDASAGRRAQLFFADSAEGGFWYRPRQGDTTGWHPWQEIITSNNISNYALTSLPSHTHDYVVEGGTDFGGEYPMVVRTGADTIYSNAAIKYRGSDDRLSVGGYLYTPRIDISNSTNGGNFNGSSDWGVRFNTNDGYIQLGPANTGHAHIYTDRPDFYFNKELYVNGDLVWHSGNDGSGSGLDADLLDGLQASQFLRSDTADTLSGTLTVTGQLKIGAVGSQNWISFAGTTGDGGGSATYTTTYIGERIYSGTEQAELIIYKGNDYASSSGPDRIRMIAANHCFDVYATSQSYPTDLNGVGALSTTRAMTIYNTGYIQTDHSFRAPIFYDSNNTNRYINPDGTSVLGFASFESDNTGYNARTSTGVSVGRYTSEYAYIEIGSTNANGGWIDFSKANGTDFAGRIRYFNSAEEFRIATDGTYRMYVNSDYLYHISDIRTPIFYDSADTNYYVNPNGVSYMNQIDGPYFRNISVPNSGLGSSYDERVILLIPKVETNTSYNNRIHGKLTMGKTGGNVIDFFDIEAQSVYNNTTASFTSTGQRSGHKFVTCTYNGIKWLAIKFSYTANPYNFAWFHGEAITNFSSQAQTDMLKVISYADLQSGTTVLNSEIYNSIADYTPDPLHKTMHNGSGSSYNMYSRLNLFAPGSGWEDGLNLYSSDKTNKWNILNDNGAGDMLRFAYNSSEKFRIQTNGEVFTIGTGKAGSDYRAPIFYDSDNTSYFANPSAQSNLSTLAVGSGTVGDGVFSVRNGDMLIDRGREIRWNTSTGSGEYIYSKASSPYDVTIHSGSHDALQCPNTGEVRLNYQGAQKLITNSSGVSITGDITVSGNITGTQFIDIDKTSQYGSGMDLTFSGSNSTGILIRNNTGATTQAINFFYSSAPQGARGSITVSSTSTAYNTSSDYRLKENVVPMTGSLERVDQLKPSRFNFIGDDKTVDGFLAHEAQEVVPEAVTGIKDAVDEEGNPEYQGIDQGKLVPLLVGAIQ